MMKIIFYSSLIISVSLSTAMARGFKSRFLNKTHRQPASVGHPESEKKQNFSGCNIEKEQDINCPEGTYRFIKKKKVLNSKAG